MICNFESDADIVNALRAADGRQRERVCRTLYVGVGRSIRRWYIAQGATPVQAEDWIQETFLKMLRSLDQFRGESRFVAWLWMIARNVRMDALRASRRQPHPVSLDDEGTDGEKDAPLELADPGPGPLEDAVRLQYVECLDEAFRAFSDDFPDRAEVITWVVEGLSIADIAARRNKSAGAMREDLSQTRKKLRGYSAHCAES
jgi:RNA polymerase sigma-70 factor (ECF subfamily)